MSEIPILNAPVYPHGYVTGRYLTAVADGPDDDHLMDFTPAKGKVIFTPETVIRRHEGPSPALVVQRPVECPINSQGYLTSPDGWRGVYLIVGIYSVRFEVQGAQVPGPKRIQVKASHTQDAPLDLVLSMPEVVPPGSVVVVNETTAQRAEAAAARAEAVVTNLESEVRAVVLASPELKGKKGDKGDKGDPGAPGALANASSYILVGPGRPDQPATTNGVIKGSEPVGAEYRSTDGAGEDLFDWRKRPTGWELAGGGSGSGIEEVSGTVTLDSTGDPIREFFTTGATTFKANDVSTLISSFTAVVWRRDGAGKWAYLTVDSWKDTAAPVPDTTKPIPGWLTISEVSNTSFKVVHEGATDNEGVTGYRFSTNGGTGWSAWQSGNGWTATGLTPSTSYSVVSEVKDAAGNTAATGSTAVQTTAAPVLPVSGTDYFLDAHGTKIIDRSTPLVWVPTTLPESGGGGEVPSVEASGTRGLGGASVVLTQDDAEITARAPSGRLWLWARSAALRVFTSADRKTLNVDGGGSTAQLPDGWATLTMRVVGSAGTVYADGVKVLDVNVPAATGNRWGFYTANGKGALGVKVAPATAASPAPTIGYGHEGLTITEDFSGGDAASLAGRNLRSSTGATVSSWSGTGEFGWAGGALGISGGKGVLAGSGARTMATRVKAPSVAMSTTMSALPTAGTVILFLQGATTSPSGRRLDITPTAVTAKGEGLTQGLGAPQAGDTFKIDQDGGNTTFSIIRGGQVARTHTAALTFKPGSWTGVAADAAASGAVLTKIVWVAK